MPADGSGRIEGASTSRAMGVFPRAPSTLALATACVVRLWVGVDPPFVGHRAPCRTARRTVWWCRFVVAGLATLLRARGLHQLLAGLSPWGSALGGREVAVSMFVESSSSDIVFCALQQLSN